MSALIYTTFISVYVTHLFESVLFLFAVHVLLPCKLSFHLPFLIFSVAIKHEKNVITLKFLNL
jgi:hypothetical protein